MASPISTPSRETTITKVMFSVSHEKGQILIRTIKNHLDTKMFAPLPLQMKLVIAPVDQSW